MTGSAEGRDGAIRATVGSTGQVERLDLDDRAHALSGQRSTSWASITRRRASGGPAKPSWWSTVPTPTMSRPDGGGARTSCNRPFMTWPGRSAADRRAGIPEGQIVQERRHTRGRRSYPSLTGCGKQSPLHADRGHLPMCSFASALGSGPAGHDQRSRRQLRARQHRAGGQRSGPVMTLFPA